MAEQPRRPGHRGNDRLQTSWGHVDDQVSIDAELDFFECPSNRMVMPVGYELVASRDRLKYAEQKGTEVVLQKLTNERRAIHPHRSQAGPSPIDQCERYPPPPRAAAAGPR